MQFQPISFPMNINIHGGLQVYVPHPECVKFFIQFTFRTMENKQALPSTHVKKMHINTALRSPRHKIQNLDEMILESNQISR